MPRTGTGTKRSSKPSARARVKAPANSSQVDLPVELVAAEVYGLFLARGGGHGDALGDWLAAERIVRQRLTADEAVQAAQSD